MMMIMMIIVLLMLILLLLLLLIIEIIMMITVVIMIMIIITMLRFEAGAQLADAAASRMAQAEREVRMWYVSMLEIDWQRHQQHQSCNIGSAVVCDHAICNMQHATKSQAEREVRARYWAVPFIPMPMPKPVCRSNLYSKIVLLEVCKILFGQGYGYKWHSSVTVIVSTNVTIIIAILYNIITHVYIYIYI